MSSTVITCAITGNLTTGPGGRFVPSEADPRVATAGEARDMLGLPIKS